MSPQVPTTTHAKFRGLSITDVPYKIVNNTPILASILVPEQAQPKKTSVIVYWHGGGLVVGQRLYHEWLADWLLDLGRQHNAIIVTADYRLMPEANGLDILEDVKDFYKWLTGLAQHLPSGVTPDRDHLLVMGASAGGYLSIMTGFMIPQQVAAIIATYPMIDMRSAHFTEEYDKPLFNPPAPKLDRSILDKHVASLKGNEVVSERVPPVGLELMVSAVQTGEWSKFFGSASELYPLEMLDKATDFPPLWILHGEEDLLVPIEGTQKFEAAFRGKFPTRPLVVSIRKGEDHGFDVHEAKTGLPTELRAEWLKDGLTMVAQHWPKI